MNIRSREIALSLAVVGFLSYAACTADKTSMMKNQEVSSAPAAKPDLAQIQSVQEAPKVVDGIFATSDHLQPIYFGLNQSKLSDDAMTTIKTNAEWLKTQPPFLIRIMGYADNRGSVKKNERLAERRAITVRDAYVSLGLTKDRFSLASKGAEDAACQPTTEECLSKSRRSDTLIEDKSLASR